MVSPCSGWYPHYIQVKPFNQSIWTVFKTLLIYLVGGLEHDVYDFPYIGNNDPNWRTHIFQGGWNHQPDTVQYLEVSHISIREFPINQVPFFIWPCLAWSPSRLGRSSTPMTFYRTTWSQGGILFSNMEDSPAEQGGVDHAKWWPLHQTWYPLVN